MEHNMAITENIDCGVGLFAQIWKYIAIFYERWQKTLRNTNSGKIIGIGYLHGQEMQYWVFIVCFQYWPLLWCIIEEQLQ